MLWNVHNLRRRLPEERRLLMTSDKQKFYRLISRKLGKIIRKQGKSVHLYLVFSTFYGRKKSFAEIYFSETEMDLNHFDYHNTSSLFIRYNFSQLYSMLPEIEQDLSAGKKLHPQLILVESHKKTLEVFFHFTF